MFNGATNFNGDLSGWRPAKVTTFENFAYRASNYEGGDLSGWANHLGSATTMSQMFRSTNFNGEAQGWQLSKVTDMKYMFSDASSFQADISGWYVGKVQDMSFAFQNTALNADLSGWDGK